MDAKPECFEVDEAHLCRNVEDEMDKLICRRLTSEFRQHCRFPVDERALDLLQRLLFDGVIEPRKGTGLLWEGYSERFFVFAATSLARKLETCVVEADGDCVTLQIAHEVATKLKRCWQEVCPIRPTQKRGEPALLIDCPVERILESVEV